MHERYEHEIGDAVVYMLHSEMGAVGMILDIDHDYEYTVQWPNGSVITQYGWDNLRPIEGESLKKWERCIAMREAHLASHNSILPW